MYHIKEILYMIDYNKGVIIGKSGKVYRIATDRIGAARYTEYSIRSSLLAFNTEFETLFNRINSAINHLRNGKENPTGNATNAINELESILKGMVSYHENKRPAIIEFCSTFCVLDDEDITIHTEDQIREKYEDWAHIPIYDFFLLASKATPNFINSLKNILAEQIPNLQFQN